MVLGSPPPRMTRRPRAPQLGSVPCAGPCIALVAGAVPSSTDSAAVVWCSGLMQSPSHLVPMKAAAIACQRTTWRTCVSPVFDWTLSVPCARRRGSPLCRNPRGPKSRSFGAPAPTAARRSYWLQAKTGGVLRALAVPRLCALAAAHPRTTRTHCVRRCSRYALVGSHGSKEAARFTIGFSSAPIAKPTRSRRHSVRLQQGRQGWRVHGRRLVVCRPHLHCLARARSAAGVSATSSPSAIYVPPVANASSVHGFGAFIANLSIAA